MKDVDDLYPARFFARRASLNWRAPIVVDAVMEILGPETVIDVGCATGDIVAEFLKRGVYSIGLEGSRAVIKYLEVDKSRIIFHDLRDPLLAVYLSSKFDLAISLEVAEHIEPEFVNTYLGTLIGFAPRILMSAAPPGQGGTHHFNCQPPSYWIEKFNARGFERYAEIESEFKDRWRPWAKKKGIKAYFDNVLYFEEIT